MSDKTDLWGEEAYSDLEPGQAPQLPQAAPARPAQPPQYTRPVAPPPVQAQEEVYEQEEAEPTAEELEEQEDLSILEDAHLRLEQGSLYKLIMKHDLFEGVDADPKAIQNVTREIRKFAKERMEIMLGMRRETSTIETLEIDFPFNALEVEVLKKLAFTATKGASQESDRFVPEVTKTTQEVPNVGRPRTLNPISAQPKKAAPKKAGPVPAPQKPLATRPAAPLKRTKLDATIDQIAREEGIPRELLEEDVTLLTKPVNQMTPSELEAHNRLISKRRGASVKSASALPMATPEQEVIMAMERANTFSNSLAASPLAKLLDTVKAMPIKNP